MTADLNLIIVCISGYLFLLNIRHVIKKHKQKQFEKESVNNYKIRVLTDETE
jgi:hypothetical protein